MKKCWLVFGGLIFGMATLCGCKDPETPEQLYSRAVALASVEVKQPKQWEEIDKLLTRCLRQNKENVAALLLRGYVRYNLGNIREAEEDFRLAKSCSSFDPVVLYWNGWIYHKKGEQGDKKAYSTAQTFLKEALTYCPNNQAEMRKSLLAMLVNCWLANGLGREKEIAYITELQKFEDMKRRPELFNAKGIFYYNCQQYADAIKMFKYAYLLDKNNFIYSENIAIICALYLRNNKDARDWYLRAVQAAGKRQDVEAKKRLVEAIKKLPRQ